MVVQKRKCTWTRANARQQFGVQKSSDNAQILNVVRIQQDTRDCLVKSRQGSSEQRRTTWWIIKPGRLVLVYPKRRRLAEQLTILNRARRRRMSPVCTEPDYNGGRSSCFELPALDLGSTDMNSCIQLQ
jgi:hypothetical protein